LRGYGYGCQAAVELAERELPSVEAFVFFAGDGANDPADLPALLWAFEDGSKMVLGCRTCSPANRVMMGLQYVLANRAFGFLCGCLTGRFFADLGPLRVIDRKLFYELRLREWTFGWTIEAQIRASILRARIREIPVRERPRLAGEQKVSRVSWARTLRIGLQIIAAGFRARFRNYSTIPRPFFEVRSGVPFAQRESPVLERETHRNATTLG
jgi:hypothetical protein